MEFALLSGLRVILQAYDPAARRAPLIKAFARGLQQQTTRQFVPQRRRIGGAPNELRHNNRLNVYDAAEPKLAMMLQS